MQEYVAGFLFNNTKVALIKKTKPSWQAGRYNAVGGKLDYGETPLQGMRREFKEETSLHIEDWHRFAIIQGQNWRCHFFRATGNVDECQSTTEEKVEVFHIDQVKLMSRSTIIGNIPWLMQIALDTGGLVHPLIINYEY